MDTNTNREASSGARKRRRSLARDEETLLSCVPHGAEEEEVEEKWRVRR